MERMEDYVQDYDYQSLQQFVSDSPWDHEALILKSAVKSQSGSSRCRFKA
jgi:hypothetical protein